jgi:DNA sulfur modification protein DndD
VILNQLVLHNVGTFAGRNVIDLTPPSRTKPVVLIGGLNGTGKTTILEAIHLAFYGPRANPSGRRSGSYDTYLRGLINRGVAQADGAAIELTFRAHKEGVEHTYWLRRSWKSTGKGMREILLVNADGHPHPALASTWNEQVDTFLPRGIAGLFFFDGEQIEALADMERSREVLRSALDALLGLDLVERLTTDLGALRRRHQTDHVPAGLRQAIEDKQQTVAALRRAEDVATEAVGTARNGLELAQKRLYHLTEELRAAGGDLLEQREGAEARAAMLKTQIDQCDDEIRHELAESAPLLQVNALLTAAGKQATKEETARRERMVAQVFAERDSALLDRLKAAKVRASAVAAIDAYLAGDRDQRRTNAEINEVVGAQDTAAFDFLIGSTLPRARNRLVALTRTRARLRDDVDQADRVMAAIPDPEALAPLGAARKEAADALVRTEATLCHAQEQLESTRSERDKANNAYESALDKATAATLAAEDDRRLVEHLERVRATLGQLRVAATRRHLERISALVLEALGMLLRKERLVTDVEIDPGTYAVVLTGVDGKVLPSEALSAGERQLLAVALLWGLARASGQPLPVVIDTPLGRLDGSHREHLLERYFPHASHQVVLLSTDTEIDEEAYERIQRYIGREYRLVFDAASNATFVDDGYFWE